MLRAALVPTAILALLLTSLATGPAAQGPPPLFDEGVSLDAPVVPDAGGPTVVRRRAARPRLDRLAGPNAAADVSAAVALNLFDDVTLSAVRDRFETDLFGHQTWSGQIDGDPLSNVSLTWKGDVLSGTISTSESLYRLSSSNGVAIIEQLDPGTFGVELPPLMPPAADRVIPADRVLRPAAGEVVDIFVYYTTAAKNGAGGQAQIEALIAQGVANSNSAYARSGVQATKRLVGTGELAYVQHPSSMSQDLNAFTFAAVVANTRNTVGADLMHLVVESPSGGACGVGWLGPDATYAHAVSARPCFSQYTFTHEVGHNMGSHHAPEDIPGGPQGGYQPYSYGYKMCSGSRFRTVMAYDCQFAQSTPRILNLSNPGVQNNGQATGTATQNNALSHAQAFPIVQAFRAGAAGTPPSVPLNLQANVVGNNITVTWQAPAQGAPLLTYIVQAGTGPGLSNVYSGPVGNVLTVSSPIPNGTYYIRVRAQNAAGLGPATADIIAVVGVPPGVPTNVAATAVGPTINLTWSAPASGGAISTYIVQAGTAPGASNLFNGAVGAGTSASGMVGPGTYYLRVLAMGPGGTSAPSAEASVTVGPACTAPAAPVLTGGRVGNVITINWNTPAGGPLSGYTVRAGSASTASNLYNSPVGLTNTVSAGVGPGNYFIRVQANAACGSSPESNEVLVTVP